MAASSWVCVSVFPALLLVAGLCCPTSGAVVGCLCLVGSICERAGVILYLARVCLVLRDGMVSNPCWIDDSIGVERSGLLCLSLGRRW